jgi:type IV pilus assembly protein PilO
VESLQFNGFEEISNLEELPEEREVLIYNLILSTYYFLKLEELKGQAPKYEPLDPAEKKNPLYQSEIEDKLDEPIDVSKEKYKEVEKDGKTYQVYSYDVKSGDTLFQLSIKYYNSEKGIELIRSWNNMKRLLAGTTIEIPVLADSEI